MKVSGVKVRKMDQVYTSLQMVMCMRVNSKMEIDKEKVAILGLIKATIRVNGLLIK
jgi:hypothetical protein